MFDIRLFGTTTVHSTNGDVVGSKLGGIKQRQVLEALALADGAPVTKVRLAELLWGANAPDAAVATLETYVCVLRRRMGSGTPACSPIITTSAGYRLDLAEVTIDLHECRSLLARAATAHDAAAVALTRRALRLCDKSLLASEMQAPWADLARARFDHELAAACGRASRAALALGDHGAAVQFASRAISIEPCEEELTRDLMRALAADGRRAGALRAFLELRRGLVEELGVEPGPQTRALYVQVLTADAAASREAVPSRVELRGLLELLRETLARMPGVDTGAVDRALAQVSGAALGVR
jgi:SARP family transcriptional regulator, regulator of embCAB operon